jgi:hypothetical protein
MVNRRPPSHPTRARRGTRADRREELLALRVAWAALPEAVPRERRPDGFPDLDRGQVYVFAYSQVRHPRDCRTVMEAWDRDRASVKVVAGEAVPERRPCGTCAVGAV